MLGDCRDSCQGIGFSRAVRDAKIRFRAGTSHCRAPDTVLAVAPRERVGQLLETKYGTAEADADTKPEPNHNELTDEIKCLECPLISSPF